MNELHILIIKTSSLYNLKRLKRFLNTCLNKSAASKSQLKRKINRLMTCKEKRGEWGMRGDGEIGGRGRGGVLLKGKIFEG